jgi:murein tripeptide amidase MpaA
MNLRIFSLISAIFAVPTTGDFEGHQVLRFNVENETQMGLLNQLMTDHKLKLDLWNHLHIGAVDIRVPAESLSAVQDLTTDIKHSVMIPNLQVLLDEEKAHSLAVQSFSDQLDATTVFKDYQSEENLMKFLLSLPGTTEFQMGTTHEGRTIRGVKFGSGAKQIVVNGGIHAREWITPASVTYIANYLLSDDPRAVKLRGIFTFHFIPVLNPDGYEFTRRAGGNRMWRKNREPNRGSSCLGTDPNRNFDLQWSRPGASRDPCNDAYYGPAAMSSKEAQALSNYISSLTNVVSYFDVHAYSQLWMYAWSYTCNRTTPDDQDLAAASTAAVSALKAVNGLTFKSGPVCKTIYQASGTTVDYVYDKLKVKYSMAVELRDTGRFGFALPASQIVPAGEETLQGVLAFWEYAAEH